MTHIALQCGTSAVSINPVSDIVLDVARAADPVKSRVAAEKLSRGEAPNQAPAGGFDHMLANAATALQASRNSVGSGGTHPRIDAQTKAYKGLEQLVLKNLMESMLPKESGAFFGNGTAGDVWRSFLADQLAAQLGKSVDLGLAHHLKAAPNTLTSQAPFHNPVQGIAPGNSSLDGWS